LEKAGDSMKQKTSPKCCPTNASTLSGACCKVDALVSIDARGQIVLPKDVREKAGIQPGEKLAVISFEKEGAVCCITLIKADSFAETVKDMLGPMMAEIVGE
jgi:antitoxin PrlF